MITDIALKRNIDSLKHLLEKPFQNGEEPF